LKVKRRMKLFNETLIFIDTETGGLNPKEHSLLTVALIVVQDNKLVDQKEWKVKHSTYHVTGKSLEVNGININDFHKEAMDKEEVGKEIIHFLSKYCSKKKKGIFVGQNTIFDKNFLEAFLQSLTNKVPFHDYQKIIGHRYIDLMSITAFLNMAGIIETNGIGLDAVIEKFGLQVEARHTALDDARLTKEGLYKMIELITKK
jgi:DNA polymerase III subunit epsilon